MTMKLCHMREPYSNNHMSGNVRMYTIWSADILGKTKWRLEMISVRCPEHSQVVVSPLLWIRMFSLLRRCIRRRNIGARKQTTNAAAMLVDKTFLGEWNSVFMPLITWLKTIYGIVRLLLLSSIISAPVFVDATTPAAHSTTAEFNKRRAEWKKK